MTQKELSDDPGLGGKESALEGNLDIHAWLSQSASLARSREFATVTPPF